MRVPSCTRSRPGRHAGAGRRKSIESRNKTSYKQAIQTETAHLRMIQGELPMRIRFLVLSLLVLCLAVSGCQQTQEPAVKVGVVDMNRLLRDSEPGKEASRFLEGMQKEIQQQIDDVQARLGKDPENENLQRELQAIYMGGQQRINAEQQNVVSQLLDLTQRLVNNYRKANGLSVVLGTDVAVAYDPALDVTNALLDEMNKQKVNFVSVSNPQPEAPAAAEAPAAEAPAKAAQDAKAAEKPAEKPAPAAEKPAAEKAAPAEAKAQ